MRLLYLLIGAALLSNAATAEELDWAQPYAGVWTLAGVNEGSPYCAVRLGTEGVIGGASIEISATCLRNFPLEEVAAWTLRSDGTLVFIDALRQAVLSFSPLGEFFITTFETGESLSLDRGQPAAPTSRATLFDGTFTLSGPNNAQACGFSVSADSNESGELEQVGVCPEVWRKQTWRRWQFKDEQLHLLAADGSPILSLTPADDFTFVTETDEGMLYFGPGVIIVDHE